MDICFVIDTSISVYLGEWHDLRRYLASVAVNLDIGSLSTQTRIGLVTYSNIGELSGALSKYGNPSDVVNGIWNDLRYIGLSTKTDYGLDTARDKCFGGAGERPGVDNLAIVITDGKSANPVTYASQQLLAIARVLVIGVDLANEGQVREMAGNIDRNYFMVPTFNQLLNDYVPKLLDMICGQWS